MPLIAVLGSTATGKSALGIALAQRFGGEIINCDSTAVYRGFDIGTDKVQPSERGGIPHHLIDIAEVLDHVEARSALKAPATVAFVLGRDSMPAVRVHDLAAEPAMRLRSDGHQSVGPHMRRNDQ